MADDGMGLDAGGSGATAYAEAVGVYLAFAVDKCQLTGNYDLCRGASVREQAQQHVRTAGTSDDLGLRRSQSIFRLSGNFEAAVNRQLMPKSMADL